MKFREVQRFTQWWFWMLLFAVAVLLFYVGPNLGAVILIIISLFFLSVELRTEIDQYGINMRFFPLVRRQITWEEVKSARVVDYGFAGGWGIRFFTTYGTIYNIKGSKGLALELKNGKKLCIGTQREKEMEVIIRKIHNRR